MKNLNSDIEKYLNIFEHLLVSSELGSLECHPEFTDHLENFILRYESVEFFYNLNEKPRCLMECRDLMEFIMKNLLPLIENENK